MKDRQWTLQCFGGFKARQGERTLERFKTQKTAALLALLALRGPQNREAVCALLWPDNPPEAARNSLSAALSALRRDLGPEILTADRQGMALTPGLVHTDVADFDRALKSSDWAGAVEIYRGGLLPNFHDDPFPALAGEYEEKGRGAFRHRLDQLEAGTHADELRQVARRASLLFGEDERWLLGLMRGHQMAGDIDAALRVYEAIGRQARKSGDVVSEAARALAKTLRRERERLQSQVESAPPPTTPSTPSALEAAPPIESAVSAPVASPLPPAWTRFFGRETERDLLGEWLRHRDRGALLITLTGAGGSGKTRLAIETLRAAQNEGEGGATHADAIFVPLAALADPDLLHGAVRDALGLPALPGIAPLEQLRRALLGQNSLLLLDNFEQLMPQGAAKLQELRQTLPDAALLVTSRVLLNLPGEREFGVAPLLTPLPNSSRDDVGSSPSVALFCDRAGLEVSDENAQSISALCRRLDGIPLAIELAAARAKVLAPGQILERLASHPNFLQSREFGLPARHQTLRATIEWSTQLLPDHLRDFFCRLSVFRAGWTLEAAEQVCEIYDALDALTALRESSLVRVEAKGGESRFRMLQTLREFGLEQLREQRAGVERAFFAYFFELAAEAAAAMQGPNQTLWLGRLDAEQDNLRAALEWARDNDAARGLQLATSLIDFWETRLSLDEGRHWIETFLKATETQAAPPERSARALSGAGRLAWYAHDLESSRSLLDQGLEAARGAGDGGDAVYALHSSARLAAVAGDNARAAELGRESVRLSRAAGDKKLLLASLIDLAPSAVMAARFAELVGICDEAIGLAREVGDDHALALALYLRAIADFYEGRYAQSAPLLEESEALCRSLGARWDLMVCLGVVGSVARELGDYPRSAGAFREALGIAREMGLESLVVVNILLANAYLLVRRGEAQNGARLLGACEAFAAKIGYAMPANLREELAYFRAIALAGLEKDAFETAWEEGRNLQPSAAVDFALGLDAPLEDAALMATRARAMSGAGRLAFYGRDALQGTSLLERGMEAARQSGDPAAIVYASRTLARAAGLGGDINRARRFGDEGVRLSRQTQDDSLLLESLTDLAFANFNDGDLEAARRNCQEAIALARRCGDEHGLMLATLTLAAVEGRDGQYEESLRLYDESEPFCRRLGTPWELMVCLSGRSDILSRQGHLATSWPFMIGALEIARERYANSWNVVTLLIAVAAHFARVGDYAATARALGASQALATSLNYSLMPILVPELESVTARARRVLGADGFEREYQIGLGLSSDEIIAFAVDWQPPAEANIETETEAQEVSTRARALSGAGRLAWYASDVPGASDLLERGLEAARQAGDRSAMVYATRTLSRVATSSGHPQRAVELGEESVRLARELGDTTLLIESLIDLSFADFNTSDFEGVERTAREALELATQAGDHGARAYSLLILAGMFDVQERPEEALAHLDASYEVSRLLGTQWDLTTSFAMRGQILSKQGHFEASQESYRKSISILLSTVITTWHGVLTFLSLSWAWLRRKDPRYGVYAAQMMGAAEAMRRRIDYVIMPSHAQYQEEFEGKAREMLGDAAFEAAWKRGFAMSAEEAAHFGIDPEGAESSNEEKSDSGWEQAALRSRALSGAGRLAWHDSDFETSRELVVQGLNAARQSGDLGSFVQAAAAFVRFSATTGDIEGDMARGRAVAEEAVRRSRAAGAAPLLLESLISLAYAGLIVMDLGGMRAVHREAVGIARELRDDSRLAIALISFSTLAYFEGSYAEARATIDEGVTLSRRLDAPFALFAALWGISNIARETGELDEARAANAEGLEICRDHAAFKWNVVNGLLGRSYLLFAQGFPTRAAEMMGLAHEVSEKIGYRLVPSLQPDRDRYRTLILEKLGANAFEAAWRRGRALPLQNAIDFALAEPPAESEPDGFIDLEQLSTRSRALSGAGQLAWHDCDLEGSRVLVHRGLETARQAGDLASFVYAVAAYVRFAMVTGDIEGYMAEARRLSEEAVERAEREGNETMLLISLTSLGYAHTIVGNLKTSRIVNQRAVALARQLGDFSNLVRTLINLASVEIHTGQPAAAYVLLREGIPLCREIGSAWEMVAVLWTLSQTLRLQGDLAGSEAAILEVLKICRINTGFRWELVNVLLETSYLRMEQGHTITAVQLMGMAEGICEETGFHLVPVLRPEFGRYRERARDELGQEAFDAAWARGLGLSTDEAFDLGMGVLEG